MSPWSTGRATPSPGSSPCPSRRPSTAPSITGSGGGSRRRLRPHLRGAGALRVLLRHPPAHEGHDRRALKAGVEPPPDGGPGLLEGPRRLGSGPSHHPRTMATPSRAAARCHATPEQRRGRLQPRLGPHRVRSAVPPTPSGEPRPHAAWVLSAFAPASIACAELKPIRG